MDLDTFAAERDEDLNDLAALYEPAVEEALQEEDEDLRTETLMVALAAAFILVYGEEGGEESSSQVFLAAFLDSMRSAVEMLVPDMSSEEAQAAQLDRMTNWFATATLGAATLSAAESAPGDSPFTKTWVTMLDENVRDTHQSLQGTTKMGNETFTVKSEPEAELRFPGEPIGPPEAWINCRCVLQIDMNPLVASAGGGFSGVVLVALPDGDRKVTYADGDTTELHQTLAYLGSTDQLQPGEREAVVALAEELAASMSPFTGKVSGMGTLGEDQDSIAITEADELQSMHDQIKSDPTVGAMFAERNNHPTWISHVTGDEFQAGDEITYDRVGAWFGGEDHQTFQMEGQMDPIEEEVPVLEDPADETGEPPVPEEPLSGEDQNQPVYGVAVPEGVESGDKRMFNPGSLSTRDLPLPLTWQRAAMEEHMGEVVVGRLDSLELRDDGMWHYTGELLTSVPETEEVIDLIAQGALRGVSIAGDSGKLSQPTEAEMMQALETGEEPVSVWEEARISGLTIVQIPAFQESFISLGVDPEATGPIAAAAEVDSFKRGSGWVTHPKETSRLHTYWTKGEGAAKIRWGTNGDFTRCTQQLRKYISPRFLNRTCAEWHHDALGYWPGELGKPGNPVTRNSACTDCEDISMIAASASPEITLVAAAPPAMVSRELFNDPKFSQATALTASTDADGVRRIQGHIATWGVCHIGIDQKCVTAPKSRTNYAHFHLGSILTTEGELPVGSLTLGTGHADLNLSVNDTRNHYDHTGTMVASVRAGEDAFGIWVSGVVCDGVSDEQVRTLMASGGISGDWRSISGNLELVAALAVNVPGFPVQRPALAASGERTNALVAAGVVVNEADEQIDAIAAAVVAKLDHRDQRAAKLALLADTQAEARLKRVADLQEV